ncbi:NUDIX domain-containing protein [Actinokineospora guangxiensis]|uniref:NUDIX domain-containing protein n=1 Tax=Actinokineospora guangxiensis TaxID=1490288 RepID=A0ABW0EUF7_9PSEU
MAITRENAADRRPWRLLGSRELARSRYFAVRRDDVIRPDGVEDTYDHVVAPASATVLAIDSADRVVLTRQYIYTFGTRQWRLPGGGVEAEDGGPLSAARRELAEETGLSAEIWEKLGEVHGADSLSNHVDHVFLATGLTEGTASLEPGEADLDVVLLPFDDAVALVEKGQMPHAASAYALLRAALRRSRP